eukprot:TRINITY_DN1116_c0_g1_i1.p1 TRINITY_DN1116_c0_g1~~TRINITY_DN1116_c0_g1_i1.p1  ORF type:complete len:463 (+),score=105.99 TRINITY_DN1116_c0_g1_i1:167-1555(+)
MKDILNLYIAINVFFTVALCQTVLPIVRSVSLNNSVNQFQFGPKTEEGGDRSIVAFNEYSLLSQYDGSKYGYTLFNRIGNVVCEIGYTESYIFGKPTIIYNSLSNGTANGVYIPTKNGFIKHSLIDCSTTENVLVKAVTGKSVDFKEGHFSHYETYILGWFVDANDGNAKYSFSCSSFSFEKCVLQVRNFYELINVQGNAFVTKNLVTKVFSMLYFDSITSTLKEMVTLTTPDIQFLNSVVKAAYSSDYLIALTPFEFVIFKINVTQQKIINVFSFLTDFPVQKYSSLIGLANNIFMIGGEENITKFSVNFEDERYFIKITETFVSPDNNSTKFGWGFTCSKGMSVVLEFNEDDTGKKLKNAVAYFGDSFGTPVIVTGIYHKDPFYLSTDFFKKYGWIIGLVVFFFGVCIGFMCGNRFKKMGTSEHSTPRYNASRRGSSSQPLINNNNQQFYEIPIKEEFVI